MTKETYRPKSRAEVARNMSAIKSHSNKTEVLLRKLLHSLGLRYKTYSSLPGKPDIAFTASRVVVFVDGDYWHARDLIERGEDYLRLRIRPNQDYWLDKMRRNRARDIQVTAELERLDWTVVRLWESEVKSDPETAAVLIWAIIRSNLESETHGPRKIKP